jgi:hypothetical protein
MSVEMARNEMKSVTHVHAQSVTKVPARCREGEPYLSLVTSVATLEDNSSNAGKLNFILTVTECPNPQKLGLHLV